MSRKIFFIISVLSLVFMIFLVSVYYYFSFFLPLKNNKELFPNFEKMNLEKDLKKINQKKEISKEVKENFGISVNDLIDFDKEVFFIDGREKEEFLNAHFNGAKNLRAPDINEYVQIKELFGIDEEKFKKSFFVIYCHDGNRSSEAVSRLGLENIKFLLEGVDVFFSDQNKKYSFVASGIPSIKKDIRDRDFTININNAVELFSDKKNLFLDGRLYKDGKIDGFYDFRINLLSSGEYNNKLNYILQYKDNQIVYVADIYTDLFYAKLLIQRLDQFYGFDADNFHVLFNQAGEFIQLIKK